VNQLLPRLGELETQSAQLADQLRCSEQQRDGLAREAQQLQDKVNSLQLQEGEGREELARLQQDARDAQQGTCSTFTMASNATLFSLCLRTPANERQYELTCVRMIQLREAHQQQASLSLLLHKVVTAGPPLRKSLTLFHLPQEKEKLSLLMEKASRDAAQKQLEAQEAQACAESERAQVCGVERSHSLHLHAFCAALGGFSRARSAGDQAARTRASRPRGPGANGTRCFTRGGKRAAG
jgi:septal ring factor EnvC (AmiA/AmiB activator)